MADEHPGIEGLSIMAKSETTPVPVVRELLPIKTPTVTVDCRNFRTKDVIVDMPDDLGPQDLKDIMAHSASQSRQGFERLRWSGSTRLRRQSSIVPTRTKSC
jgi:hypothetical protein